MINTDYAEVTEPLPPPPPANKRHDPLPSRFDGLLQPAGALLSDQHRLRRGHAAAAREAIVQRYLGHLAAACGSNKVGLRRLFHHHRLLVVVGREGGGEGVWGRGGGRGKKGGRGGGGEREGEGRGDEEGGGGKEGGEGWVRGVGVLQEVEQSGPWPAGEERHGEQRYVETHQHVCLHVSKQASEGQGLRAKDYY